MSVEWLVEWLVDWTTLALVVAWVVSQVGLLAAGREIVRLRKRCNELYWELRDARNEVD